MKKFIAPFGMAFLFIVSQLIAAFVSIPFKKAGIKAFENPNDPMNVVQIIIYFIVFTAIILIISKYKENLIKYVILLAFFLASISIFQAFFYFIPFSFFIALLLSIIMVVLLIKYPEWYVIDFFGVFIAGGIAAIFAISILPIYIILLLIILAIYDFIAVYKTKHMVKLAETVANSNLPLLMIFPKKEGYSYLKDELGGRNAIYMGLGDIVIPGMLISASFLEKGFIGFISTLAGSLIGFAVLMILIRKSPQPGLPYLNGGAIAGYLLAHFL